MFSLIQGIASHAGAFFMSVALFLGAQVPTVELSQVATDTPVQEIVAEESVTPTPSRANVAPTIPTTKNIPASNPAHAPLSITDVEWSIDGRNVTFSWKTTVDARSSITVNGRTVDSVEGISRVHTVTVADFRKGGRYPYEVAAKTLGSFAAEDKVARQFKMPASHTITIGLTNDSRCYIFAVTDGDNDRVRQYPMIVIGKTPLFTFQPQNLTTNSLGEADYCKAPTSITLEAKDVETIVGGEGVTISNIVSENLTTGQLGDTDEYGVFSIDFEITK